jgi:DNA-binding SARP family transcriptional activator
LHVDHYAAGERPETTFVTVTVLGGFGVTVDGVATPADGWRRRSAAALVKVLALTPGHRLHRERVMDLLWPDEAPDRRAARLHKAAHFARRAAGHDDAVSIRDDMVSLFAHADVTVDAVRFEHLAQLAVSDGDPALASEALGWYGGELLPGDPYEEWTLDRRTLLHLRWVEVLRVAGEWRRLAAVDPTDEHARTELIRRHLAAGDHAAALCEQEHLEDVLERELGIRADSRLGVLLGELADLLRMQENLLAELFAAGSSHADLR